MTNKVYQFSYDDQLDIDIHEWLQKIPRSRKAETVRHALRFYIAYNEGSSNIHMPRVNVATPVATKPIQQVQSSPHTVEKKSVKKKPKLPIDGNF